VGIASAKGDFPLIKMNQTCLIGWMVITSKGQSWIDIPLLFGEIFNLDKRWTW
jgi:hypothetical protein